MVLCRLPVCRERSRCAQNPPAHRKEPVVLRGRVRGGLDWIIALRGSADIIRGQVSAALTAAANVNTGNSQHEFPCGQRAVGRHGRFCPRQPPRLKCRLHLEIFAVPIYATCRSLGVPSIAHLMSCGAAKKQRIPVAISPICSVATQ